MKKRIISILLCAVMLLCTIPFSVSAAVAPEGDTLSFTGLELYRDVLTAANSSTQNKSDCTEDITTYAAENAVAIKRTQNNGRQWKTFNMDFSAKYNSSLAEYTYVVIKAKSDANKTEYAGYVAGVNTTASVGIHEYLMCGGVRDTWYIKVIDLGAIATNNSSNATWDANGLLLQGAISMLGDSELIIGGFAMCKSEEATNTAANNFKGTADFDSDVGDIIADVYGDDSATVGIIPNASFVMSRYKYLSHDAWHQGVSLSDRK